jgi:hypothetical protein
MRLVAETASGPYRHFRLGGRVDRDRGRRRRAALAFGEPLREHDARDDLQHAEHLAQMEGGGVSSRSLTDGPVAHLEDLSVGAGAKTHVLLGPAGGHRGPAGRLHSPCGAAPGALAHIGTLMPLCPRGSSDAVSEPTSRPASCVSVVSHDQPLRP